MKKEKERFISWFLRAETLVPLAIGLLTFLVFSGVLRNEFLNWDDDANFLNNYYYRGLGWAQISWMFTTFHLGPYIPLTWLTLGLDYVLWGLNPFGYHLTNLLLHCANAMVFYFVGRRLLALAMPGGEESNRRWLSLAAAFSALLFSLHPLRVESVAWVTERRDVLVGLFFLLTVLFYLKAGASAHKAQRARWFYISLALFGFSLLAKASGLFLPLALLVLDIYPLGRLPDNPRWWFSAGFRRVWLEKVPFLLLVIPAGFLGLIGQAKTGALLPLAGFGVAERLSTALFGLAFYLWKTFVPFALSPYYPLPDKLDIFAWPFLLSGLLVIVITVIAFTVRRKWPVVLVVWACYVITLLPILGFAQSGRQIAADRYTYLSSFGLTLLASWAVVWLLKTKWRLSRRQAAFVLCAPLAALSFLTWRQVKVWHDSESVWRRTLVSYPELSLAHNNLGMALAAQGKTEEAIQHYKQALRTKPDYPLANNNLANALAGQGRTEEALLHYELAVRAQPDYADAHYNLALAFAKQGRREEAILHYRATIKAQPDYALAQNNLANALAAQGKLDEAVLHYNLTLKARPDLAPAYNNLANALARQGRLEEAVRNYRQALKLNPGYEQAARNLEIIVRKMEQNRSR